MCDDQHRAMEDKAWSVLDQEMLQIELVGDAGNPTVSAGKRRCRDTFSASVGHGPEQNNRWRACNVDP